MSGILLGQSNFLVSVEQLEMHWLSACILARMLPMQLAGAALSPLFRLDWALQSCKVPTTPCCIIFTWLPSSTWVFAPCLNSAQLHSFSGSYLFLSSSFWKIVTHLSTPGSIDIPSLITSLSSFPQPKRSSVVWGWWRGALFPPVCFSETLCLYTWYWPRHFDCTLSLRAPKIYGFKILNPIIKIVPVFCTHMHTSLSQ